MNALIGIFVTAPLIGGVLGAAVFFFAGGLEVVGTPGYIIAACIGVVASAWVYAKLRNADTFWAKISILSLALAVISFPMFGIASSMGHSLNRSGDLVEKLMEVQQWGIRGLLFIAVASAFSNIWVTAVSRK